MTITYLLDVRHISPMATIRRERRLPYPGTILVHGNERVHASDVIAETEIQSRHAFLDIARGLGVGVGEVPRFMQRAVGDTIDQGDVIAGPVGIARRTIRAPGDGKIVKLEGGKVLFQERTRTYQLRAGFPGTVVASDGATVVSIETVGALLNTVWGNGKRGFGVMRMVDGDPGGRLVTDRLDIILRGAVLVAGICDHPAPLHQATELSVRGLILGSMISDLIPVARRMPYPIVLTEGFGILPMNPAAFDLLNSNGGREAAVDAEMASEKHFKRTEVIIPLPATQEVSIPDEIVPIAPGVRVRVLRPPYQADVGTVREVLERAVPYPSGILARSASVELQGVGIKTVPLANLEILQ